MTGHGLEHPEDTAFKFGPDGDSMRCRWSYETNIKIGKLPKRIRVFVLEARLPFIVGGDFMAEHEMNIYF